MAKTKSTVLYRDAKTFNQRREEANKVLKTYSGTIPIIVEAEAASTKNLPPLRNKKFLVPDSFSLAMFIVTLRKRMSLSEKDSLFVFVVKETQEKKSLVLPQTSISMARLYADSKSDDGFLYLTYAGENVFGNK
eukprot:m.61903 g.61903  ORF g.61903 m.61903 type:complete len:134 (+) comp11461_c0_seq1:134-535(+)